MSLSSDLTIRLLSPAKGGARRCLSLSANLTIRLLSPAKGGVGRCLSLSINPPGSQRGALKLKGGSHGRRLLRHCGGACNGALVKAIRRQLRGTVQLSDEYGVPARWVETAVCAWLARQRLDGRAGSLPQTTGVESPAVLGAVYR